MLLYLSMILSTVKSVIYYKLANLCASSRLHVAMENMMKESERRSCRLCLAQKKRERNPSVAVLIVITSYSHPTKREIKLTWRTEQDIVVNQNLRFEFTFFSSSCASLSPSNHHRSIIGGRVAIVVVVTSEREVESTERSTARRKIESVQNVLTRISGLQ